MQTALLFLKKFRIFIVVLEWVIFISPRETDTSSNLIKERKHKNFFSCSGNGKWPFRKCMVLNAPGQRLPWIRLALLWIVQNRCVCQPVAEGSQNPKIRLLFATQPKVEIVWDPKLMLLGPESEKKTQNEYSHDGSHCLLGGQHAIRFHIYRDLEFHSKSTTEKSSKYAKIKFKCT